jgi:hypothetical protein
MGIVEAAVIDSQGSPVQGATVEVYNTPCIYLRPFQTPMGEGITGSDGSVQVSIPYTIGCVCARAFMAGVISEYVGPFWLDILGNGRVGVIVLPTGGAVSHFEITGLFVKHLDANRNLIRAWDMLAEVGSPEPGHDYGICVPYYGGEVCHRWPKIPANANYSIECYAKNLTDSAKTVRFRTQTCPRGTSGLPPMPIPPCGQLVDSGASVTIQPGETKQLPIWYDVMWSENIDEHNEIVDVNGQVYNCLVLYVDNTEYRADDWFTPIDSGVEEVYQIQIHVQSQQGTAIQGATVVLT